MKTLYESILDDDFEDKMNGVAELLVQDKFKLMSISLDNEAVEQIELNDVFKNTLNTEVKRQGWEMPDNVKGRVTRATFDAIKDREPLIKAVLNMPLLAWKQNFISFLRRYLKTGWDIILNEKSSGVSKATGMERLYADVKGPKGEFYELYISLALKDKTKRP